MSTLAHAQPLSSADAAETVQPAKTNLIGLTREELAAQIKAQGEPAFRAKQLWHWLYHRGEKDFAEMTTLSKAFRAKLADSFTTDRPAVTEHLISSDGTEKWLLRFDDGNEAEMVYIPESDRGTLCVSSQVGCTLTCKFCHTGTQRLVRNLTPAEILGQILLARDDLTDWPSGKENRRMTNIVMMGMGEPLYNYDNVKTALKIAMDPDGVSLSKRRITLSTSGVVPMMTRCGEELDVNLAVSLHATTDEVRSDIVPLNKKYDIGQLLDACQNYPGTHNARRITFEYVMLKGVNDTDADAHRLANILANIPAKINLIPFNPWPGVAYECSDDEQIERFSDLLYERGYSAPIRRPRGRDIFAACGQLKSESEKLRKSERLKLEAAAKEAAAE